MKALHGRLYAAILLTAAACGIGWTQNTDVRSAIVAHYKRAEAALASGQAETAATEFHEILKLDPANSEAYANLGVIAYKQGDYSQAKQLFSEALKHNSLLWDAKAFLGLSEMHLGDAKEGEALLMESFSHIHNEGLKIDAGVAIIKFHQESKTLDQVVDVVRDLQMSSPDNSEVLYIAYRAYSALAAKAVATMYQRAPDSGRMHQILGEAAMTQDDFPGAILQFRKAIDADPKTPGIHYELGRAILTNAQDQQARDQAQHEFETELSSDPSDFNSEYELGEVFRLESEIQPAEDHYRRALQLYPNFADAEVGLGTVLEDEGKASEAISHFTNAIRMEPENESAHYRLARAYRAAGRIQEANEEMTEFQKLHQLHPSKSSLQMNSDKN